MNDDLREAVEFIKQCIVEDDFNKMRSDFPKLKILIDLAESVLSAKWPEDEKIRPPEIMLTPQQESWNKCLDACLPAHAKIVGEKDEENERLNKLLESTGYNQKEQAYAISKGLHSPWDFQNERVKIRDVQIKDLSEKLGAVELKRVDELAELSALKSQMEKKIEEIEKIIIDYARVNSDKQIEIIDLAKELATAIVVHPTKEIA